MMDRRPSLIIGNIGAGAVGEQPHHGRDLPPADQIVQQRLSITERSVRDGAVSQGELREIRPGIPKSGDQGFGRVGATLEQQFEDVFVFRRRCEVYGADIMVPGFGACAQIRSGIPKETSDLAKLRSRISRAGCALERCESAGIAIVGEIRTLR